jgi:hypothetical protein
MPIIRRTNSCKYYDGCDDCIEANRCDVCDCITCEDCECQTTVECDCEDCTPAWKERNKK